MSIRSKIMSVITLCLVASFFALYGIVVSSVKTENSKVAIEQTSILNSAKSEELGLWLQTTINEFRLLAELPAFKSGDPVEMQPYVDQIVTAKGESDGPHDDLFAYGTLDGDTWVNGEDTFRLIPLDDFREIYHSPEEYLTSEPITIERLGETYFLIYYPIESYTNYHDTLFISGINVEKVKEILNQVNVFGGTSWLMNKNGEVYTMNAVEFRNVLSVAEKSTLTENFTEIYKESGHITLDDSMVFYSEVQLFDDWMLCTKMENDAIFANTNEITSSLQIVMAILCLLSLVFAHFVSLSIVRPIKKLQSKMISVNEGNLTDYYESTGKDEIYFLGQTYNLMLSTIEELIEKISTTEEQKRRAYQSALQAQINPHFLYNTLASLKWLSEEQGATDVAHYIDCLSGFFKTALSDGNDIISLKREVEHAKNYLEIQEFRYSDTVSYSFEVDESLGEITVPKLILQPLIENAIYHGLKHEKKLGKIDVKVYAEGDFAVITVTDNGIGIGEERLVHVRENLKSDVSKENFGLNNVSQRVLLHCGKGSYFDISSKFGVGTCVTIKINREGLSV